MKTVRVLRFMSRDEADTLAVGFSIGNDRNHRAAGNGTDSIGSCFAVINEDDDSIYQAARRLSGIVTMEVCLVGYLKQDPERFIDGFGWYTGPDRASRVKLPEISTTSYNSKDFTEFKLFLPDPAAGPLVYSESWREPLELSDDE